MDGFLTSAIEEISFVYRSRCRLSLVSPMACSMVSPSSSLQKALAGET